MNKLYYILIVSLLVCGLSACQHSSGNSVAPDASALIVGKWNLQQEKTVQYVNGMMKTDTTYLTSPANVANLQFNKDGTYHSAGHYVSQIGSPIANPLNGGVTYTAAQDSISGTYSIKNTSLNFSSLVAGFANSATPSFYGTTVSTLPTYTLVSNTSQINELSASKLTIHTEFVYSETLNSVVTTYKNEIDFYYTK
jgi:hypothetical protein